MQRLVLLRRAVAGGLVLLARRFELGAPLIELGLRDHALIQQRLDAIELALRELLRGARRLHFGNVVDVELGSDSTETGFDLRGIGLRLGNLRFGFG